MTTARCPKCGAVVQFNGLMAGCPHCGALVRAIDHSPEQPPTEIEIPQEPIVLPPTPQAQLIAKKEIKLTPIILGAIGVALACGIFVSWLFMLVRGPTVQVVHVTDPAKPPVQSQPAAEPPPPAPTTLPAITIILPTSAPVTLPATTQAIVQKIKPVMRTSASEFSDDDVERAIKHGVDYMIAQFPAKRLKGADAYDPDTFAGLNALCVYSLLVAGQDLNDPRLSIKGDFMKGLIERMKEMPMEGSKATYSRSIRATALGVYNRLEDRTKLAEDSEWLIKSSLQGAWTYSMPAKGQTRANSGWDNSNSQYGALGIWAAANVGIPVPATVWADIENHWADCQLPTGGWSYNRGGNATLAMTAAGVNMLFVASDQQGISRFARKGRTGVAEITERGLEWLDEGTHVVDDTGHPGYTRYSLERVGLASGYKFFGEHDWYRELAEKAVKAQKPEGYWEGTDPIPAETAFTLLFLCRGRMPVFMSKLRFDGNWANHPRDLQNESNYLSKQLERSITWQVADIDRDFKDWTNAPLLMISSDAAPTLGEKQLASLKAYVESGGLIVANCENNSAAFTTFAQDTAKTLFPRYELKDLPEDHPLYTSVANLQPRPKLQAVTNGARLLMIFSPTDIAANWTKNVFSRNKMNADLGLNLFVYAAGKREFRHRLDSPLVPPPTEAPVGTVTLARIKYDGNYDPEPAAWPREARLIERDTSVHINVKEMDAYHLAEEKPLLAHILVTGPLNDALKPTLQKYVEAGGILLIENWSANLDLATEDDLHPLDPSLGKIPSIRMAHLGKGIVFITNKNLSTALLDCRALSTNAITPKLACDFAEKVLLLALQQ